MSTRTLRRPRQSSSVQHDNTEKENTGRPNGVNAEHRPKAKTGGKARKGCCSCGQPDDGSPMILCSECKELYVAASPYGCYRGMLTIGLGIISNVWIWTRGMPKIYVSFRYLCAMRLCSILVVFLTRAIRLSVMLSEDRPTNSQ
ncbi:uncharacterized protein PHACADRAFT_263790 [Phanerochaete carnosa HHB-10118-sp]|uniref:Uncharacterized protein n=1 Tax=Phanerochaete carnosa (strain HHB-10118-sp) TaxID=650164 RepID=K5VV77_PHACS|nr:uncharacterized protein PHACADRAFT_263790 [Phanerochaete carnosa HHB-10118-sp]EKM50474.1 hypothetical protein PHACADRAFT_263790 [Phanerochaete carnosa HHB-10118-sp]